MFGKNLIFRTVLFMSLLLGSPMTSVAATCNVTDVTSSQSCIGAVRGNDSQSWFNTYGGTGAFGTNQWLFAEKIENSDSGGAPVRETIIDVGLDITPPVDGEAKSGTWSLNSNIFNEYSNVALVFKAGPEFTAYLLDGSSTSGTWGNNTWWTRKGLSHASVYVTQTAVPLPAAVWLFGSGLVGLVTFSRRKMSS